MLNQIIRRFEVKIHNVIQFFVVKIILGIYGIVTWGIAAGIVIIAVAIVYLLMIGIIASAAQAVLVAALYRFATTGQVSEEFKGFAFDRPFVS